MDFAAAAAAMAFVYTQQAAAPVCRAAVGPAPSDAPPCESESELSPSLRMPSPAPEKLPIARPEKVGVRQEIRTFFYPDFENARTQKEALQRRDLFILGFTHWMSLPKEDIDSYTQIAGVHGRPMSIGYGVDAPLMEDELLLADEMPHNNALTKLKYNDRSGPGDGPVQFSNMGVSEFAYCKHGRPTFMTWHRPYVYLAERAIRKCAKYLVDEGLVRGNIQEAKEQVKLIRLPYWNWCAEAPVPDVLLTDTIALTQFSMDGLGTSGVSSDIVGVNDRDITGLPHQTVMPNPFKSFKPTAQQFEYFNGEVPAPEKFGEPQGTPGTLTDYDSNCVFGPSGTLRTPGWSSYLANHLVKSLRSNVGRACMHKDFIAHDGDVAQSASHWFEAAHNALHNVFSMAIGPEHGRSKTQHEPTTSTGINPGVGTIMGRSAMLNDCSTFDPAFFFHHCFVDCQLAMQRAAYPKGAFISHIKHPKHKDPHTTYYPAKDPVPAVADLKEHLGQSRQWATSAFHPWTTGLFPELFPETESLMKERRKLRQQAAAIALDFDQQTQQQKKDSTAKTPQPLEDTYVPRYVDSSDTEICTRWGVTYQILLTEKAQREGRVKLPLSEREHWMTKTAARSKFIFDFTEDPFLRVVKQGSKEPKLVDKIFPWDEKDISSGLLQRLFNASTTNTWVLQMKLPKFFRVSDGFAVGRSWTLNAYWWDEENSKQPAGRRRDPARLSNLSPKDVAFVGSASVFAPFNLRACLNCQHDNDTMLISIDLTDMIIERGAAHLTTTQIREQIDLQAVGLPADMLPPYTSWWEKFEGKIIPGEQPVVKGLEEGSVPQVLMKWKEDLRAKIGTAEAALKQRKKAEQNQEREGATVAAAAASVVRQSPLHLGTHALFTSQAHTGNAAAGFKPPSVALVSSGKPLPAQHHKRSSQAAMSDTEVKLRNIWRTFQGDPSDQARPRISSENLVSLLNERSKPVHSYSFVGSNSAPKIEDHARTAAAASHVAAAAASSHKDSTESGVGDKRRKSDDSSGEEAASDVKRSRK